MKPKRPENETNEERFKRIAEARANVVLEKLRLLGKCSNKRLYSYSKEDVETIFTRINQQVRDVRRKFDVSEYEKIKL